MWILTCPIQECGHEMREQDARISTCGEYACPKCGECFQWEPSDEDED